MTTNEFNSSLMGMKPDLTRYAMSLTANRDNALDLLQDTFLKAISNRDKFADFTNLKGWVLTIMKNTFINNYRRMIKENTIIDGTQDTYYIDHTREREFVTSESEYFRGEIEKEIDTLSYELREPFRMHIEGYKYEEIADKLGLKMGTVKSRIFFARRRLMLILKDYKG
ncbi:MAG: RNA polymerase sigma factor [Bacteroidales bacterium]